MNGWTERVGLLEQSWWKHNILVTPFKQFIVFIPFMLPDTANQFGWSRSSFWARQESFERKHQLLLHHCFGFLAYGDFATSWDNQLASQTNCVPPFSYGAHWAGVFFTTPRLFPFAWFDTLCQFCEHEHKLEARARLVLKDLKITSMVLLKAVQMTPFLKARLSWPGHLELLILLCQHTGIWWGCYN